MCALIGVPNHFLLVSAQDISADFEGDVLRPWALSTKNTVLLLLNTQIEMQGDHYFCETDSLPNRYSG